MCGIAGIVSADNKKIGELEKSLRVMNHLQSHRGPDDQGVWTHSGGIAGFGHRRLSIIDLKSGSQPMKDRAGNVLCYNGELYNFLELKKELATDYEFFTTSDSEVILAAYRRWGEACVERFRGMFSFAIWDTSKGRLFCARDHFGIKPFYYVMHKGALYFSSEVKALLPFLPSVRINYDALRDYAVFQLYLKGKTLFEGINELLPAHTLTLKPGGQPVFRKYWEIFYTLDFEHTPRYFEEKLRHLMVESVEAHMVSDVPVGSYLSGGVDSSMVAAAASKSASNSGGLMTFHGKFGHGKAFDESFYAKAAARDFSLDLKEALITEQDFTDNIEKVIYSLDYPIAGPGSFPQYMVSELAASQRKVVLGGLGGDEIFGGYVRYLIAYFEQCIKGSIEGTLKNGNFIVTYESIIPNLKFLESYKPLLKSFFAEGLFDPLDSRYYRLVDRSGSFAGEVRFDELPNRDYSPFESFREIFNGENVGKESYFDKMTHFDFKTLLPALLQVEDRVSMAHGLESRVPIIDREIVELAATMPADIKFKDGTLKMVLINSMRGYLPPEILNRSNKMGFPVPLNQWLDGPLKGFFLDIFQSEAARQRGFMDSGKITAALGSESTFGRKLWGLLSLELWCRTFVDGHKNFVELLQEDDI